MGQLTRPLLAGLPSEELFQYHEAKNEDESIRKESEREWRTFVRRMRRLTNRIALKTLLYCKCDRCDIHAGVMQRRAIFCVRSHILFAMRKENFHHGDNTKNLRGAKD